MKSISTLISLRLNYVSTDEIDSHDNFSILTVSHIKVWWRLFQNFLLNYKEIWKRLFWSLLLDFALLYTWSCSLFFLTQVLILSWNWIMYQSMKSISLMILEYSLLFLNYLFFSSFFSFYIKNHEFWRRLIFYFFHFTWKHIKVIKKSSFICSMNSLSCVTWWWWRFWFKMKILYSLHNFSDIFFKYQFQYVKASQISAQNWCQNFYQLNSSNSTSAIRAALFSSKVIRSDRRDWCSSLSKTSWSKHN